MTSEVLNFFCRPLPTWLTANEIQRRISKQFPSASLRCYPSTKPNLIHRGIGHLIVMKSEVSKQQLKKSNKPNGFPININTHLHVNLHPYKDRNSSTETKSPQKPIQLQAPSKQPVLQQLRAQVTNIQHTLQSLIKQLKSANLNPVAIQTHEKQVHIRDEKLQTKAAQLQNHEKQLQTREEELQAKTTLLQTQKKQLQIRNVELQSSAAQLQTQEKKLQIRDEELQSKAALYNSQAESFSTQLQIRQNELNAKDAHLQSRATELQSASMKLRSCTSSKNRPTSYLRSGTSRLLRSFERQQEEPPAYRRNWLNENNCHLCSV